MKFLVDHQLPTAMARFLEARGVDCEHVLDLGLEESSDLAIWEYAAGKGRVVISKDEDFVHMANAPVAATQLVWIRIGNCRKHALLAAVERIWPQVEAALIAGERIIEIR